MQNDELKAWKEVCIRIHLEKKHMPYQRLRIAIYYSILADITYLVVMGRIMMKHSQYILGDIFIHKIR